MDLGRENRLRNGCRKGDDKLRWRTAVAGEPLGHSCVGVVVIYIPDRGVCRVGAPMGVYKRFGVRVVRIALVRVLNRSLGERQEQARHCAVINYAAHLDLIVTHCLVT